MKGVSDASYLDSQIILAFSWFFSEMRIACKYFMTNNKFIIDESTQLITWYEITSFIQSMKSIVLEGNYHLVPVQELPEERK